MGQEKAYQANPADHDAVAKALLDKCRDQNSADAKAVTPETIEWHDANTDKPDSDMTVLCWGSEGFFCGYWDDSLPGWIGCESGGSVLGVTHWANPEGPK